MSGILRHELIQVVVRATATLRATGPALDVF